MGCASSAPPPSVSMGKGAYPKHPTGPPAHKQQQQPPPPPQQHPQHQPAQQPQVFQQSMQLQQQQTPAMQQQPPPQAAPPPAKDSKPEHVNLTEELVNSLLSLDTEIATLESRNVFKQYAMKKEQAQQLEGQVRAMGAEQQQLEQQTKKEHQDVINLQQNTSVRQMWTQQQFDQQMSKEQQEYMDALNRQEVHQKQLAAASHQLTALQKEAADLKVDKDKLQGLYDRQDEILAGIFDGKYGSEAEYRLESELDMLMERKQRVAVARYKWTNSHTLVKHACGQLNFGIRRWGDVLQIPAMNTQLRYQFAAEARNNFVAASQNIATSQKYLNTIQFPYCTPDEMTTLNKAVANIFTDMMQPERHKHAMECYVTVYKRAAALIQWFQHVINKTIVLDLEKTTKNCAAKQKELKMERIRLVQAKVREQLGEEVANRMEEQAKKQSEMTSEMAEEKDEPELALLVDADSVSQNGDADDLKVDDKNAVSAPTPLGQEELAPTPGMDDLFGNMEELKKQHEEQVKEYERQQEVNKTRADQDLQAKLAARRSRRQRQAAQESEMAALQGTAPY